MSKENYQLIFKNDAGEELFTGNLHIEGESKVIMRSIFTFFEESAARAYKEVVSNDYQDESVVDNEFKKAVLRVPDKAQPEISNHIMHHGPDLKVSCTYNFTRGNAK